MESLADTLGLTTRLPDDGRPRLEDITDAKRFAQAVLTSPEFRTYIVDKLTLGDLPPAIVCRLMDYAWGKPAERVEHTGKSACAAITAVLVDCSRRTWRSSRSRRSASRRMVVRCVGI